MPEFNQQRQVLMEIVVELMRLPTPPYLAMRSDKLLITAVKMSTAAARQLIHRITINSNNSMSYAALRQKIHAANIRPATIDLLLSDNYLFPLTALTHQLKFDVDSAMALLATLTEPQLVALPQIIALRLPEFTTLFFRLLSKSRNSYTETVAKIMHLLARIDSPLEPWHITTFFNATVFVHDLMATERQEWLSLAQMEGTDQCHRRGQELARRIYPAAIDEFVTVLKYTLPEARELADSYSQFEIENVFPIIKQQFRCLLREIFYLVTTFSISSTLAVQNILQIIDGLPAAKTLTAQDSRRIQELNLQRWYVANFVSPAMHAYVMNKTLDLPNPAAQPANFTRLVQDIIADIYADYSKQQILRQYRAKACQPIVDCVLPQKLALLELLETTGLLTGAGNIVGPVVTELESKIALDLAQCDLPDFTFPHNAPQHGILHRHKPVTPVLTNVTVITATTVRLPAFIEDSLVTEELETLGKKRSVQQVIAQSFLDYQTAAANCYRQIPQNISGANRRLLAHATATRLADVPSQGIGFGLIQKVSHFIYNFFGAPLLRVLHESPTYFPPTQPLLWNNSGNNLTNHLTLFHAHATTEQLTLPVRLAVPRSMTP